MRHILIDYSDHATKYKKIAFPQYFDLEDFDPGVKGIDLVLFNYEAGTYDTESKLAYLAYLYDDKLHAICEYQNPETNTYIREKFNEYNYHDAENDLTKDFFVEALSLVYDKKLEKKDNIKRKKI